MQKDDLQSWRCTCCHKQLARITPPIGSLVIKCERCGTLNSIQIIQNAVIIEVGEKRG